MIDAEAQSVLMSELESDERLLWAAKPSASRAFGRNVPMMFVGGCFTLFAMIWILGAAGMGAVGGSLLGGFGGGFSLVPFLFPLFGVPFIIVGIYVMAQPFLARNKAATGACGLTDKRAIIIEGGMTHSVKSYGRRDLQQIERRDLADGSSDVIFARERYSNYDHDHHHSHSRVSEIGFFGVNDGREAERILRWLSGA